MENCEICGTQTDFIKKHHIHSQTYGGTNEASNQAYICSECHDKVHCGLIIIEGRFGSMNGKILIFRNYGEDSVTGLPDPKVWLRPDSEKRIRNQISHFSVSEA